MSDIKENSICILVVDDEFELRDGLAHILTRKGFSVTQADSGNAAIEALSKKKFDLVLSDIRMADGDGIELLKAIRKNNPHIPIVIMVTGFSDYSTNEILNLGAQAVFEKPFNTRDLVQTIRDHLKQAS